MFVFFIFFFNYQRELVIERVKQAIKIGVHLPANLVPLLTENVHLPGRPTFVSLTRLTLEPK